MDLRKTPRGRRARGTVGLLTAGLQRGLARVGGSTISLAGMRVTAMGSFEHERLLTPAEVAALFRVDPKTVTRWAQAGKLTAIRTLGGHRRYRESEVSRLLEAG